MKKTKRRRGRPRGNPLSRRELAARRANLERARAAPKDLIYRPTEKRMAASLANLRKAIAARRSEAGNERVRLNALKPRGESPYDLDCLFFLRASFC